ncbi:hypothetical protein ACQCN2_09435 [Brevibacillus ginsengisoli]|uniref:hypothetical protein n=1 Tax=Brevibacillus ginsengisoli TaxID=363854 RepID=UPI003CF6F22E
MPKILDFWWLLIPLLLFVIYKRYSNRYYYKCVDLAEKYKKGISENSDRFEWERNYFILKGQVGKFKHCDEIRPYYIGYMKKHYPNYRHLDQYFDDPDEQKLFEETISKRKKRGQTD